MQVAAPGTWLPHQGMPRLVWACWVCPERQKTRGHLPSARGTGGWSCLGTAQVPGLSATAESAGTLTTGPTCAPAPDPHGVQRKAQSWRKACENTRPCWVLGTQVGPLRGLVTCAQHLCRKPHQGTGSASACIQVARRVQSQWRCPGGSGSWRCRSHVGAPPHSARTSPPLCPRSVWLPPGLRERLTLSVGKQGAWNRSSSGS